MDPKETYTSIRASAKKPAARSTFSSYQLFIVALLAFLQFTIILDFMIISPLGAIVMPTLHISPRQFGFAVSSYAFSAGISGLLTAGFADRFDRKNLILFFYGGFIFGTGLCALAIDYHLLLFARVVTGFFGGVVGSVILAIATDLFPLEKRGRVIGFIQTAFAASQVFGIPAGLYLANRWNWQSTFVAIVAVAAPAGIIILIYMKPVAAHLALERERSASRHLARTLLDPKHTLAFAATALLSAAGFMLLPFGSAFVVNNLGLPLASLPTIYLFSGLCIVVTGPLIGRASDAFGKFRVFCFGSIISIIMVAIWTNLGPVSLIAVTIINGILFVGIYSRMIPSQALISAVPEVTKRGSFNAIRASLQQCSGGVASVIAGAIIVESRSGQLLHFDWLGDIVIATSLLALVLMWLIHKAIPEHLPR